MGILAKVEAFLKGKKTYILVLAGIFAALAGFVNGQINAVQLVEALWAALVAGSVRSAITNK